MKTYVELFHRLWTKAVGQSWYDKSQWIELENCINAYPRLVQALRNLASIVPSVNNAGVWIEYRRTARVLLKELGETEGEVALRGDTMPADRPALWPFPDSGPNFTTRQLNLAIAENNELKAANRVQLETLDRLTTFLKRIAS